MPAPGAPDPAAVPPVAAGPPPQRTQPPPAPPAAPPSPQGAVGPPARRWRRGVGARGATGLPEAGTKTSFQMSKFGMGGPFLNPLSSISAEGILTYLTFSHLVKPDSYLNDETFRLQRLDSSAK